MDVVYGGTSSMLGAFSSFTSLGRPFLLWSPYLISQHKTWVTHVFVTKGTGYAGFHATLRLLKDSYHVTTVDNRSCGNIGDVKVIQGMFPKPGRLQFIYVVLGDAKVVYGRPIRHGLVRLIFYKSFLAIKFWRGIKERRHDYFSWLRIMQIIATAVILGLLWWRSDVHSPKDMQNQAGLLFFIAVFWAFFPVFTIIFTFPQERAMLKKERAADMYKLSAYFIARTTSDIPLDLILPLIFLLIVYFMAGLLLTAQAFFLTMLIVFLCIVAAQGLGLAIGAAVMDLNKATTMAYVVVMAFMLAGGFFVKLTHSDVPVFISWLSYLSFKNHTYRLILKVQYWHISSVVDVIELDSGLKEAGALATMAITYRILAYMSLRQAA
ncbi:ABC transporter G family member 22-like [Helianthus annuus]|uniref:ABC transporter G family member 22-like n=1 Tax=Helianthus annuus TaxID=4232 RepID=UPI001652DFE9|nr:ABC transporter G family member 22-like [Helianthus annuus]